MANITTIITGRFFVALTAVVCFKSTHFCCCKLFGSLVFHFSAIHMEFIEYFPILMRFTVISARFHSGHTHTWTENIEKCGKLFALILLKLGQFVWSAPWGWGSKHRKRKGAIARERQRRVGKNVTSLPKTVLHWPNAKYCFCRYMEFVYGMGWIFFVTWCHNANSDCDAKNVAHFKIHQNSDETHKALLIINKDNFNGNLEFHLRRMFNLHHLQSQAKCVITEWNISSVYPINNTQSNEN